MRLKLEVKLQCKIAEATEKSQDRLGEGLRKKERKGRVGKMALLLFIETA